jgi:hypothetical protein
VPWRLLDTGLPPHHQRGAQTAPTSRRCPPARDRTRRAQARARGHSAGRGGGRRRRDRPLCATPAPAITPCYISERSCCGVPAGAPARARPDLEGWAHSGSSVNGAMRPVGGQGPPGARKSVRHGAASTACVHAAVARVGVRFTRMRPAPEQHDRARLPGQSCRMGRQLRRRRPGPARRLRRRRPGRWRFLSSSPRSPPGFRERTLAGSRPARCRRPSA